MRIPQPAVGGLATVSYAGTATGEENFGLSAWVYCPREARDRVGTLSGLAMGLIELYLDGVQLNERPIPAERVITDIANVDAGYAGVYAGHLGETGTAEARIDGFTYRID
jgi:hypothetical protein